MFTMGMRWIMVSSKHFLVESLQLLMDLCGWLQSVEMLLQLDHVFCVFIAGCRNLLQCFGQIRLKFVIRILADLLFMLLGGCAAFPFMLLVIIRLNV
jgi:hypothetical protein